MLLWTAFCVLSALYIALLLIEDRRGERLLLRTVREALDYVLNETYVSLWRIGTKSIPLPRVTVPLSWVQQSRYVDLVRDVMLGVFTAKSRPVVAGNTTNSLSQVALHKQDVALSDTEKRRRKATAIEGKTRLQSTNKTA